MVKINVGLFFGSFNPIHLGHLMLANYMIEYTELNELWFVVSPQNPLKEKKTLLPDFQRFEMVSLAIEGDTRFTVSDIEFRMPKPSYTIDTLTRLSERHSNYRFFLICGMDSLLSFPKWKNYEQILANYTLFVYPRKNCENNDLVNHHSVKIVQAPKIEISSSFIRKAVSEKKDIRYFMPEKAYHYMTNMHFYEK
jgi:nicotinate-nucleotide adenylyltransferase